MGCANSVFLRKISRPEVIFFWPLDKNNYEIKVIIKTPLMIENGIQLNSGGIEST